MIRTILDLAIEDELWFVFEAICMEENLSVKDYVMKLIAQRVDRHVEMLEFDEEVFLKAAKRRGEL